MTEQNENRVSLGRIYRRFSAKLKDGIIELTHTSGDDPYVKAVLENFNDKIGFDPERKTFTIYDPDGEEICTLGSDGTHITNKLRGKVHTDFKCDDDTVEQINGIKTWIKNGLICLPDEIHNVSLVIRDISLGYSPALGSSCWIGIEPNLENHPEWRDVKAKRSEQRRRRRDNSADFQDIPSS